MNARKLRLLRAEDVFAFILAVAASFGEERLLLCAQLANVVVEVSADAALQAGVFRHPLRFVRTRPDLRPEDVDPIG